MAYQKELINSNIDGLVAAHCRVKSYTNQKFESRIILSRSIKVFDRGSDNDDYRCQESDLKGLILRG